MLVSTASQSASLDALLDPPHHGELFKRKTLMFNGYPEVASLYSTMDLRTFF
jgi:hypothetical protein